MCLLNHCLSVLTIPYFQMEDFLYKFDDDKLKIIRIMAEHIVDLENHYDILMKLDFDSNKRKAPDILNVHDKGKR